MESASSRYGLWKILPSSLSFFNFLLLSLPANFFIYFHYPSFPPSFPSVQFLPFIPSFLPSICRSVRLFVFWSGIRLSVHQSISPFVHSSFLLYQLNLISPPVPYSVLPFITSFFNASFLPPFIPPSSLIT